MAQQIAGATHHQSADGENVAANMDHLSALSEESTTNAVQAGQATEKLACVAANLQALARHFDN